MVSTTLALGLSALALVAVAVIGIVHSRGRIDSVEDFVVARGTAGSWTTTATLVASSMGAWILFSPAEAGVAFGGLAAVLGYAIGSALPLVAFVSVGTRIRRLLPDGHTLTEYALARYGPRLYAYVLVVTVFYLFVFLAAEMTGIALALELVAGIPAWQTALLVGGVVLAYTAYGGLVASIATDAVQVLVVVPLLVLGFGAVVLSLGGPGEMYAGVATNAPHLVDPTYPPGVTFGFFVALAILGANVFNQGQWQRVYAATDGATVRRSFALAGLLVIPMVLLSGLFGVAAAGAGVVDDGNASVAFFALLSASVPDWLALLVVVLAVLLVASTADTLFNALASLVTVDLPRVADLSPGTLQHFARVLTIVVALGAIVVGAQGYSVLALFLLADLLGAATFVPFLHGLYSTRASEGGALAGSVLGLAVGLAFFPTVRPLLAALPVVGPVLPDPSFLWAFVGATGTSGALTMLWARIRPANFEFDALSVAVTRLDESVADGGVREAQEGRRL